MKSGSAQARTVESRSTKLDSGKMLASLVLAILMAAALPAAVAVLLSPTQAHAQNIGQRTVNGIVVGADGATVPGATVFLKDLKTKLIRSFTSDPTGKFRFTQVDMAEDHELWAEKAGHKSAVKTVSQWDARKDYETELRMK